MEREKDMTTHTLFKGSENASEINGTNKWHKIQTSKIRNKLGVNYGIVASVPCDMNKTKQNSWENDEEE